MLRRRPAAPRANHDTVCYSFRGLLTSDSDGPATAWPAESPLTRRRCRGEYPCPATCRQPRTASSSPEAQPPICLKRKSIPAPGVLRSECRGSFGLRYLQCEKRRVNEQVVAVDIAQVQCGPASAKKNGPERQVGLNVLVLVPLHPACGLCRPCERRQRSLRVLSGKHVKGLDANTPFAAQINNVIAESLVFKPGTFLVAALYNFTPVAPLLRTVPHDEAVLDRKSVV